MSLAQPFLYRKPARSLVMQIGQIVESLMGRDGLTLEAIAERVRAQGAKNVRYQHIQQLIQFPNRQPRYLPELAKAFGMTVEEFLAYGSRARYSVAEPSYSVGSQPLGITAQILASAHQLVRLASKRLRLPFDPEQTEDAELVLLACDHLIARGEDQVTPDNVVDFIEVFERARGGKIEPGTGDTRKAGKRARA